MKVKLLNYANQLLVWTVAIWLTILMIGTVAGILGGLWLTVKTMFNLIS